MKGVPPYMAQEVFARLTSAPYRRLVLLSDGTHAIALEKNRMHLIRQVAGVPGGAGPLRGDDPMAAELKTRLDSDQYAAIPAAGRRCTYAPGAAGVRVGEVTSRR